MNLLMYVRTYCTHYCSYCTRTYHTYCCLRTTYIRTNALLMYVRIYIDKKVILYNR